MAITSGLFNSINGDRAYDEKWFALYFATFIGNGVFPNPSTGLQVYANINMTTKVRTGQGWINGYFIVNQGDYILQHDNADGVLKRIDRVVMKLNHLKREIEIVVKKGAFASNPVAPTLQRDTDAYELALADVLINNGATQIAQANITDQRLNSTLCGIVHGTVDQVDTTTIFNQYQAWFNDIKGSVAGELDIWQDAQEQEFITWFESIKDILEGDVAGNLASRIAVLEQQMTTVNTKIDSHSDDLVFHNSYGSSSFSSNAIAVTLNPAPASYKAGMTVRVQVGNGVVNTGPCTLNINGLGAKPVRKNGNSDLQVGEFKGPAVYTLVYDGAIFFLQGEGGGTTVENKVVEYTTPGSHTFTVPAGVSRLLTYCWGAGGGGGGGHGTESRPGGGGGAGGFILKYVRVKPGDFVTIMVGRGGAGGGTQWPGTRGTESTLSVNGTIHARAFGGGGGMSGGAYGWGGQGGSPMQQGADSWNSGSNIHGKFEGPWGSPLDWLQGFSGGAGSVSTHSGIGGGGGGAPSDLIAGKGANYDSGGFGGDPYINYYGGRGGYAGNPNGNTMAQQGYAPGGGGGGGAGYGVAVKGADGAHGKVVVVW
ncbi:glycine-rich domain-containing protein [Lysinibacillus fusiformis]|uniref:glycine-rich domain-containing protein n=1 Tax=Lysinibacillus fusiformis TaxID=28031 RepID=UPI003019F85E